jgi:methenyltetrahydrofolate cyclohydrolase
VPALAQLPLGDLLDRVASGGPGPSGGACAAWACALGAGLIELAAGVSLSHAESAGAHRRMRELCARAGELRAGAVGLADRDVASYAAVLAAQRRARGGEAGPGGGGTATPRGGEADGLPAALSAAAEAPLLIAETAAEVASLAAETARTATTGLRGDAIAGSLLAEAAARAAAELVAINLAATPDDPRLGRARDASERAAAARSEALG